MRNQKLKLPRRLKFSLIAGLVLVLGMGAVNFATAGGGGDGDGVDILPYLSGQIGVDSLQDWMAGANAERDFGQGLLIIGPKMGEVDGVPVAQPVYSMSTFDPIRDLRNVYQHLVQREELGGLELVLTYVRIDAGQPITADFIEFEPGTDHLEHIRVTF